MGPQTRLWKTRKSLPFVEKREPTSCPTSRQASHCHQGSWDSIKLVACARINTLVETASDPALPTMYEVVIGYKPRAEGELRLEVGDKISRSQEVGGGWVLAFNHRSQETGLIPLVCLTPRESRISRRLSRFVARSQRQAVAPKTRLEPRDDDANSESSRRLGVLPEGVPGSETPSAIIVEQPASPDGARESTVLWKREGADSPASDETPPRREKSPTVQTLEFDGSCAFRETVAIPTPGSLSTSDLHAEHKTEGSFHVPQSGSVELLPLDQSSETPADNFGERSQGEECTVPGASTNTATEEEQAPTAEDQPAQLRSAMLRGRAKKKSVRLIIPEPSRRRLQRRRKASAAAGGMPGRKVGAGTFPRLMVSVVVSAVLVACLYLVLVWSFQLQHEDAIVTAAVSMYVVLMGVLLSSHCRALMVLTVPSLFSALGRAVMLSIISAMILAGPGANILDNSRRVAATVACVLDTAHNQSQAMRDRADRSPDMPDLVTAIEGHGRVLREEALQLIQDIRGEVRTREKNCDMALNGYVIVRLIANDSVLTEDQKDAFLGINGTHRDSPWTYPKMDQEATKLARGDDVIDWNGSLALRASALCRGHPLMNWSNVLDNATAGMEAVLGRASVSFLEPEADRFNLSWAGVNEEGETQRLTMEVEEELQDPISLTALALRFLRKLLLLALMLVVVQSYLYLRSYLSRCSFDNVYITPRLKEIDIERRRMGLHGIFPLRRRERKRYVDLASWKLSPLEKAQNKSGIVILLFHMLIYAMVLLEDFLLFYLLNLMTGQLKKENSQSIDLVRVKPNISGTGILANILKDIAAFENSSTILSATTEFQKCLTNYDRVELMSVWTTLAMYLATLLLILLHGYGSRLRHRILAFYYPLQEEARTQHLYLNIYIKRKSFIREAQDLIQPCEEVGDEASGFLEKRAAKVSLFRAICPCLKEPVFKCHSCKQFSSHMRRCSGEGCSTLLCRDCVVDTSGLCPHCIEEDEDLEECPTDSPSQFLIP